MAFASVVDVSDVVETRKLGRFQLGIWSLAFLMVFIDGLAISQARAG